MIALQGEWKMMVELESNMFYKLIFSITFLLFISTCQMSRYAKGVLLDNQCLIENHKTFIQSTSFTGIIKEKSDLKKQYGRRLLIEMDRDFASEIQFNPYYSIQGRRMDIAVSDYLYNYASLLDTIFKKEGSLFLEVRNRSIPLVSLEKNSWLDN
jgi:hypothetical protein